MTDQKKPAQQEKTPGIGGFLTWGLDIALLWAVTAVVPVVVAHLLAGAPQAAFTEPQLQAYATLAGAGLILGLLWRALIQKTALGLALLVVLITAPLAFLGCVLGPAIMAGAPPKILAVTWVSMAVFAVQSTWFTAFFAVRGAQSQSRWWLLVVAALLAAPLGLIGAS